MKLFPLVLESYFVKEASFALIAGFDQDPLAKIEEVEFGQPKLQAMVRDGQSANTSRIHRVELEIKLQPGEGSFPYEFKVVLVGIFRVPDVIPEEKVVGLVSVNAPSVLYSSAREYIASFTGRSYYQPVLLPLVTFSDLPFYKNEEGTVEKNESLDESKKSKTEKGLKKGSLTEKKQPKSET